MEEVKRIAIFGVNGYIGRHLARELSSHGEKCDGYDVQAETVAPEAVYHPCDVCNADFWKRFDPTLYKSIVFLSGLSGVERSFQMPQTFVDVNISGLLGLLQRLSDLSSGAPRVILPSSRLVYKGNETVAEDAETLSRSVYAATKIAAEALLSAYQVRYGVPYVALRICVPYGNLISKDYSYGTLGFFMSKIRQGQAITVYGDGSNTKTYTYIEDLCQIIHKCVGRDIPSGIYNIGGYDYSLKEVAEIITNTHGGHICYLPWPEDAARVEMGSISLNAHKLDLAIGKVEYKRLEDCVDML